MCEGKDGLASERKGSKLVEGVMIDDVVCVYVCGPCGPFHPLACLVLKDVSGSRSGKREVSCDSGREGAEHGWQ